MIDFSATFIFLFAVINPIGKVPIFIAVTRQCDTATKKRIALKATLVSAGILVFFAIAVEFILDAMDIPIPAFQVAGGIVLFAFGMSMIFSETKPEDEAKSSTSENDIAIYPLAFPSIAGTGTIVTAVMLTENIHHGVWEQIQIAAQSR